MLICSRSDLGEGGRAFGNGAGHGRACEPRLQSSGNRIALDRSGGECTIVPVADLRQPFDGISDRRLRRDSFGVLLGGARRFRRWLGIVSLRPLRRRRTPYVRARACAGLGAMASASCRSLRVRAQTFRDRARGASEACAIALMGDSDVRPLYAGDVFDHNCAVSFPKLGRPARAVGLLQIAGVPSAFRGFDRAEVSDDRHALQGAV